MVQEKISGKLKIVRVTTVASSMNVLLKDQLKHFNEIYELVGITTPDKKYYDEIAKREGIRTIAVEMTRKISPARDLVSLLKLIFILYKEKPAIVHTHTPKAGLLGMIASKFAGVPIRIHTVAGLPQLEFSGIKRYILDFTERITYRCACRIYPNSFGLASTIVRLGYCKESKLKVIGNGSSNGIDVDYFDRNNFKDNEEVIKKIIDEQGIKRDDFIFCYVGRIVKDKGIRELIAAFTSVCDSMHLQGENAPKLFLIGSMNSQDDPIAPVTIESIEKHPDIYYFGHQMDVRPYLYLSKVFIFPSYREGFPNVILQAGAMGLPAIVTDINGCNEIIKDGYNGLIVKSKSVQALEMAIRRFMKDKDLLESTSFNSRPKVVALYERKQFYKELNDEYSHLVSQYLSM